MIDSAFIATIALILINVGVFTLPFVIDFSKGVYSSFQEFVMLGWKDNDDIKSGEYYRLLTSIFLHADVLHLLSNMYALWIFGRSLNPLVMLPIFFVSGIVGNILSFLFNKMPSVGASGAIFGLVGYILALSFQYPILSGSSFDLIFFVVISFIFASIPGSRIDIYGHLGGVLAGFILGFVLK
jgi:rhomboid protease GluP